MEKESIITVRSCTGPAWEQFVSELAVKFRISLPDGHIAACIGETSGLLVSGDNRAVDMFIDRCGSDSPYAYMSDCHLPRNMVHALERLGVVGKPLQNPMPNIIVMADGVPKLVELLQALTSLSAYDAEGLSRATPLFFRMEPGSSYVRWGRSAGERDAYERNGYITLHASSKSDMNKLRKIYGRQPAMHEEPDKINNSNEVLDEALTQMINTNPQDEMVLGFLLRDNGLRLPVEVQQQGAPAIHQWIVDTTNAALTKQWEDYKVGLVVTPELAPFTPPTETERVKFTRFTDFEVRRRHHREDFQEMTIEVPKSVMDEAAEDNDGEIIAEWIRENQHQAIRVGGLVHGDETDGDHLDEDETDQYNSNFRRMDGSRIET